MGFEILLLFKKQTLVDCMQSIREFFDREGAFLAAEQEYIHYFALPFVIEPEKHPSFQGLFEVSLQLKETLRFLQVAH